MQITQAASRASTSSIGTPGRIIDLIQQGELSVADVDHVVIDEADRMADMGFLPQVEWILRHVEGRHQTLLFSATLDGVIGSLVRQYQTDPVFHEVESRAVTVDEMIASLPAGARDGQGEGGGRRSPATPTGCWCSPAPSAAPTRSPTRSCRRT